MSGERQPGEKERRAVERFLEGQKRHRQTVPRMKAGEAETSVTPEREDVTTWWALATSTFATEGQELAGQLLTQITNAGPTGASREDKVAHANAALTAVAEIAPKDPIEAMLSVQMVAVHNAAMECLKRAHLPEQPVEFRQMNLNQANKLTRTFTTQMEALNRHRGKGQQKVTVEHVHVHEGGQAIVGAVEHHGRQPPGGGDAAKNGGQAHARSLTYAPEPAMRSPYPQGDAVPVAGGAGEDPLPHARRGKR